MPLNNTINVLHLVHSYGVGGAEKVVHYLCKHSPKHFRHTVCSFFKPPGNQSNWYEETPGEIIFLNKKHGNDPGAILRLANIIKEKDVHIVHAQGWATYVEGLTATKLMNRVGRKFVYAFHGKTMNDVLYGVPLRRRVVQNVISRFDDAIVAPSNHMASDYASEMKIPRSLIRVIHNGIDLSCYDGGTHKNARKVLGIEDNAFVVGFVGRLDPVKNLDGLLMAFKRSIDLFSDKKARLLVVGDGQELQRLKDLSKTLELEKQVYFSGMRNDVGFCLSAMDVYVQPSFYEGHSNTILEAMASGLPVISTHVGGTPEIVTHGDSGFLFKPGDTEEIAMAIAELRNNSDKRGIMAEKGRQKVKDLFSVDTMVKNYIGLFDELLR